MSTFVRPDGEYLFAHPVVPRLMAAVRDIRIRPPSADQVGPNGKSAPFSGLGTNPQTGLEAEHTLLYRNRQTDALCPNRLTTHHSPLTIARWPSPARRTCPSTHDPCPSLSWRGNPQSPLPALSPFLISQPSRTSNAHSAAIQSPWHPSKSPPALPTS
ncbi:hypothetical protein B0T16DRAFT_41279 [Cercophora newfieldiana]|uniref:Uncharacterized protein n=1 Tax=Cercophora newfieldiana TaxID=92897 RepID=A0AA39YQ32_9PEZI|nr:hypothetical protein B0T16DRAFT_41279 [Cercophora newfieldiana]